MQQSQTLQFVLVVTVIISWYNQDLQNKNSFPITKMREQTNHLVHNTTQQTDSADTQINSADENDKPLLSQMDAIARVYAWSTSLKAATFRLWRRRRWRGGWHRRCTASRNLPAILLEPLESSRRWRFVRCARPPFGHCLRQARLRRGTRRGRNQLLGSQFLDCFLARLHRHFHSRAASRSGHFSLWWYKRISFLRGLCPDSIFVFKIKITWCRCCRILYCTNQPI